MKMTKENWFSLRTCLLDDIKIETEIEKMNNFMESLLKLLDQLLEKQNKYLSWNELKIWHFSKLLTKQAKH